MRTAKISRKTKETEIDLMLNIDGKGKYAIVEIGNKVGVRFVM